MERRVADVIAERLATEGCRHAFGMPGGEVLTMMDALQRAGIAFHLVSHENSGGFMAEGVWHQDGAPGILLATIGPGAMNAVNVIANAMQDRVPLILLTGCVDQDERSRYTHQIMDQSAIFAPITKASFEISSQTAALVVDKAVRLAMAPRMGPVHLDLPINIAALPSNEEVCLLPKPLPNLPAEINWISEKLSKAEKPLILVGVDAVNENAGAALQCFVEHHSIPVLSTYKAKGIIPEDHPLSIGAAGLSPKADAMLLPFVAEADLIILAGYDPIEMRPGWRDPFNHKSQTVIDLAAEPNMHGMHRASHEIIGPISPLLLKLCEIPACDSGQDARIAALQDKLREAFPRDEEWGAAAIIDVARSVLPRDTLATVDSGAHRILLSQQWQAYEPRSLMQSNGLCTMGCALSLALGAKRARPERPVVAFTGDAGLLMVLGELAHAAENKLPIIIIVFVDASLALIEKKQRAGGLDNLGVDFAHHDFAAIAEAFGGNGETVSSREGLQAAIDKALTSEKFTLIAAQIERGAYDGKI